MRYETVSRKKKTFSRTGKTRSIIEMVKGSEELVRVLWYKWVPELKDYAYFESIVTIQLLRHCPMLVMFMRMDRQAATKILNRNIENTLYEMDM